jgi:LPS-assembly lipoprotein
MALAVPGSRRSLWSAGMTLKGAVAAIMLAGAAPALISCGFTPLYATPGISSGLSAVSVEAPDGRTAYLLRERLDDSLGRDRRVQPEYRLSYTVLETRDPRGLGADNAASRYELNLTVDFTLTRLSDGQAVRAGQEKVLIIYDAVAEPYAGVSAQQDGQERAAAEAARRIRLDLAEYFASVRG